MASRFVEDEDSRLVRRSKRSISEPAPRPPLKRNKKTSEKQAPIPAVNGTGDEENEDSPSKKSRLGTGEELWDRGDANDLDIQESAEDVPKNEGQETDINKDTSEVTHIPKTSQGAQGDVTFSPHVVLGKCYQISHGVTEESEGNQPKSEISAAKSTALPTKSGMQIGSPASRQVGPIPKVSSMADYRKAMEIKAKDIPEGNHLVNRRHPISEKPFIIQQPINNIPKQEDIAMPQKNDGLTKTAVPKKISGNPSRGFSWCCWCLILLVLLSSVTFLTSQDKVVALFQRATGGGGHPSSTVKLEKFGERLSALETQFPNQRPDLWKRSKIHLEEHLRSAHPSEPVSLILTAGRSAEATLRCLAEGLASSYSSALDASVLHINGTNTPSQDSDDVKLDIDRKLQAAFEGDKPAAVIHRLEELPPGSCLIFYRYCDHENAAFKRVFLLFTVLLPQDEVGGDQSLKEVEELVHDYVKGRLVSSPGQAVFNVMDNDKFGGLWSRISHLILPVVSEVEAGQKGC
ncbi:uncharacterized protein KZ484_006798 isoform 2-T2 [Pholidichthys leucotaenia]